MAPALRPVTALAAGGSVAAVVAVRGSRPDLALWAPFVLMLVAVAAVDINRRIVPNRMLAPAAAWALVTAVALRPSALPVLVIAGVAALSGMMAAALLRPSGLGMGDAKLAGVMGLYLGPAVVPALLVAFLAGAAYGAARIAREGAPALKVAVPFAPFLALGGLVGVLAGPGLVALYGELAR